MQFLKLGVNLADTSTSSTGTQHGGVNANVVGFHFLTTQYFHQKDLKKKHLKWHPNQNLGFLKFVWHKHWFLSSSPAWGQRKLQVWSISHHDQISPYTSPVCPSKFWPWLGRKAGGKRNKSTLPAAEQLRKDTDIGNLHTYPQKCNVIPMSLCRVVFMNNHLTDGHMFPGHS